MKDIGTTGINPEVIREQMTRALTIDQELNYRLESADMIEEIRLLREQALCCFKTLAQMLNYLEIKQYEDFRTRPMNFNLSNRVDDIVSMVRSRMRLSRIEINDDIEKCVMCCADPDRFSYCAVNLIVNALQSVDAEEGSVLVTVRKKFDYAIFSVIDNGYAMTQQQLAEYMEREDGSRGFDILKKFCESVGTTPIFETTENGGFCVTIKIPLPSPDEKIELNSDAAYLKTGTMSPYSILLYKLDDAIAIL